jgi:hypothetical protein
VPDVPGARLDQVQDRVYSRDYALLMLLLLLMLLFV